MSIAEECLKGTARRFDMCVVKIVRDFILFRYPRIPSSAGLAFLFLFLLHQWPTNQHPLLVPCPAVSRAEQQ